MDNKKGEKGKYFFHKIFGIEYVFKYNISIKIIVIELIMDNGKVKKVNEYFLYIFLFHNMM